MPIEPVQFEYVPENSDLEPVRYQVERFNVIKAMQLQVRLGKLVAPTIAGIGDIELSKDVSISVEGIVNGLFGSLDENTLPNIIMQILEKTTRNDFPIGDARGAISGDGKKTANVQNFDDAFNNNFGEMVWIVTEVLKINYNSFTQVPGFKKIGNLVDKLNKLNETMESQSPAT